MNHFGFKGKRQLPSYLENTLAFWSPWRCQIKSILVFTFLPGCLVACVDWLKVCLKNTPACLLWQCVGTHIITITIPEGLKSLTLWPISKFHLTHSNYLNHILNSNQICPWSRRTHKVTVQYLAEVNPAQTFSHNHSHDWAVVIRYW